MVGVVTTTDVTLLPDTVDVVTTTGATLLMVLLTVSNEVSVTVDFDF